MKKLLKGFLPKAAILNRVIGKIRIHGQIVPSISKYGQIKGTTPDKIIKKIKFAEMRRVKAIIFEINSPGGAVVASKEIADAIKKCKIPTVAWIRDVGASGAYWIASACDRIVADICSSVGSIGVLSPHLEFSELMKKYGIGYEDFKSGEYKDMGIPFRKTKEEEREIILKHLTDIHQMFIEEIAKNRGLDKEEVEKYSNGLVFIGKEAKEKELVDRLGGIDEAIKQCEIIGRFKHQFVFDIEDLREELLLVFRSIISQSNLGIGVGIAKGIFSEFLEKGSSSKNIVV